MYLEHYGLAALPFTLTPDTHYFYELTPHAEALEVLVAALDGGEGIIKVIGEVGTGKTLLCRKMMNQLAPQYVGLFLPNPYVSAHEIRHAIATCLKIKIDSEVNQASLTQAIERSLMRLNEQGKKLVVFIDEAQALPDETLEAIRLFTNIETEKDKLIQVVLFGQPELDMRLRQSKLRQLQQRVVFSYQLRPLTFAEAKLYIQHRLKMSGYQGEPLFNAKTVKLIWRASRGIPRLLNILCHKALIVSYGKGDPLISIASVQSAIADTDNVSHYPVWPKWLYFLIPLVLFECYVIFSWLRGAV
ncbi:AAA family ATPase [Motilimonas sp. 1_MG-2023]|uniref:ExeA family protein n=1 Tax=Motilimonas sp. 1_MG-2023 TaxID=3062672 RepID=UPI0026E35FE7|nr:AAA family ATPase [Motilimonas sp. 1_MG-2023]MDO6524141.1 AAA family ATPase [Motilimonas sp. 1_MG-2023]